jgi:NAD(P)-dependent dehydrogenase (short-subunit alcohol dehydrogenase family)
VKLDGKVAIITGAGRGIGRHLAQELARHGVRLALAVRTANNTVQETIAAAEAAGSKAVAVLTDLAHAEQLEGLVETTLATFGRVDILINSAADIPGEVASIDMHTRSGWLRQFDVNLHAPFTLMGLVAPHMRAAGGGVIINLTSSAAEMNQGIEAKPTASMVGGPVLGYGTTKAALNRLSNLVANQLRSSNITVASVNPGFTRTEHVDDLITHGKLATASAPHSMDLPVETIINILTASDPLEYSGRVIRAADSAPLVRTS